VSNAKGCTRISGTVKPMKVIQVYYPDAGAFGCWDVGVEIELSKLSENERRTATVICLPESMRPRGKRNTDGKANNRAKK
jgi:hypothetical protein